MEGLFSPRSLAAVLESVYRVEQARADWIRGILEVLAPQLDRGLGVLAYSVDVSRPDAFETSDFQSVMTDANDARQRFDLWHSATPLEVKRKIHTFGACALGRELTRTADITEEQLDDTRAAHGYLEMFGLNALDPTGRGCTIAVPFMAKSGETDIRHRELWERLAAHIATASRLQTRLAGQDDVGDATLSASGKLEAIHPTTRQSAVQDALRDAAVAIDRARAKLRDDPSEVTRLWRSLTARRWTLVDRFDRGGRRYVIAFRNDARIPEAQALTEREEQVVRAVQLGHSNKLIAYELDLSPSTVATLLNRAMKKLGVATRVELIAQRRSSDR
ncbi:MAG: LuxR C-terminal-related transcriptional regulator [Polyangiaceae bacterium]